MSSHNSNKKQNTGHTSRQSRKSNKTGLGYRGISKARPSNAVSGTEKRSGHGQAKTLNAAELQSVFDVISKHSNVPESDRLKVELSFHAGLRVGEIAELRLEHVTDASGKISRHIHISADTAKFGRARDIPMHPRVAVALEAFRIAHPNHTRFALSRRFGKIRVQSSNALTVWFGDLYLAAGLEGCSSHSGRRTMITRLARQANRVGASLRDVQKLAGHARLDTTARYIEPSDGLMDLINAIDLDIEPEPELDPQEDNEPDPELDPKPKDIDDEGEDA